MDMVTNQQIDVLGIRVVLGITQEQLADTVGVSQPTVALWESGKRNPSGSATILLTRLQQQAKKKHSKPS
jgi:DNA-binding transcriptional regulator YiaG